MEFLNEHVLWWHWVVLGLALAGLEILVGTFIVIWFGVAAMAVGALSYLHPLSFAAELFVWAVLSLALTYIYWHWFRRHETTLTVGQSEGEHAGIEGKVIEELGNGRYKAYFDLPVLGDREWVVEPEGKERLHEGDTVFVARVYGQIVKVIKGE